MIRFGRKLSIPNKDGMLIKMSRSKNVIHIARKYKISQKKILEQNDLKNPDFIPLNTVLFIPDAKPQNIIVGFMWPTRNHTVTSSYGWRRNPFNRKRREFHKGMDIKAHYSWIRASKYGKVTFAGWLGGYGRAVIVAHPGGWKTLYAHLSRIIVRRGQYVKQGQYVARSGSTGRSTGPHLHFEIIKRGRHKNPYVYLKRNRWKHW
jgi:murein DD-endopeptidase MepM/ murein hydrolase activator NlpD